MADLKDFVLWISVTILSIFQGAVAEICTYDVFDSKAYRYCSKGCCSSSSMYDVCCTYTYTYNGYTSYTYSYSGLATGSYWGIGVGLTMLIAAIVSIVACCCRRRNRSPGVIVNGQPQTVVCSSNTVQTAGAQPGVYPMAGYPAYNAASPPMQPGYNQPMQPGYNPPMQPGYNQPMQPGYNPSMSPPGYTQPMPTPNMAAQPPSYQEVAGGKEAQDNKGFSNAESEHTYDRLQ